MVLDPGIEEKWGFPREDRVRAIRELALRDPPRYLARPTRGFTARPELLGHAEKARYWTAIEETIPQMTTYERRTDRDIQVFRLRRTDRSSEALAALR